MSGTLDHANITVKIDSKILNALDLSTPDDPFLYNVLQTLSNGTSLGQATQQWHDQRTISASGSDALDLAGSLVNAFGVTVTFTKIKAILVRASSGNTNNVNVTRPASNGFVWFLAAGDGFAIQPGAFNLWVDPVGVTVTASTGDLLTLVNSSSGTGVTYDIWILGTD